MPPDARPPNGPTARWCPACGSPPRSARRRSVWKSPKCAHRDKDHKTASPRHIPAPMAQRPDATNTSCRTPSNSRHAQRRLSRATRPQAGRDRISAGPKGHSAHSTAPAHPSLRETPLPPSSSGAESCRPRRYRQRLRRRHQASFGSPTPDLIKLNWTIILVVALEAIENSGEMT